MTGPEIAPPERVDLPLSGMTCAACARSIERTLANTPGVERAHVNFATATATVEFRPGQAKVGDLIGAIEDLLKGPHQVHDIGGHFRLSAFCIPKLLDRRI